MNEYNMLGPYPIIGFRPRNNLSSTIDNNNFSNYLCINMQFNELQK